MTIDHEVNPLTILPNGPGPGYALPIESLLLGRAQTIRGIPQGIVLSPDCTWHGYLGGYNPDGMELLRIHGINRERYQVPLLMVAAAEGGYVDITGRFYKDHFKLTMEVNEVVYKNQTV